LKLDEKEKGSSIFDWTKKVYIFDKQKKYYTHIPVEVEGWGFYTLTITDPQDAKDMGKTKLFQWDRPPRKENNKIFVESYTGSHVCHAKCYENRSDTEWFDLVNKYINATYEGGQVGGLVWGYNFDYVLFILKIIGIDLHIYYNRWYVVMNDDQKFNYSDYKRVRFTSEEYEKRKRGIDIPDKYLQADIDYYIKTDADKLEFLRNFEVSPEASRTLRRIFEGPKPQMQKGGKLKELCAKYSVCK